MQKFKRHEDTTQIQMLV